MIRNREIHVGIGFATGRKNFQKVLGSYLYTFKESGLVDNESIKLHLFVAYDTSYKTTKRSDYTEMRSELLKCIASTTFIGEAEIAKEIDLLTSGDVIDQQACSLIFGKGYASQRNTVLYYAIKENMDFLIFFDDDEYPVAVTNTRNTAIWGGQHVLATHLKYIFLSDLTHGHHCGYISPIPYIEYNNVLEREDFRTFITAISNDILNWENVEKIMNNGGVTYADTNVLLSNDADEVAEKNGAKFISGANLCINLRDPRRIFPFYNPPGARGEDTFLSTCLAERKVLRVPSYTFHDGFSTYNHLLEGVLPTKLKFIRADSKEVQTRFLKACIGWIRYKPLFLYITEKSSYAENIREMRSQLEKTLPRICEYFDCREFGSILDELNVYDSKVLQHHKEFEETKKAWSQLMEWFFTY